MVGDDATRVGGTDTWRYDAAGRASAYSGSVVVTDGADREVLVRSLQEARVRDGVLATEALVVDAGPAPHAAAGQVRDLG